MRGGNSDILGWQRSEGEAMINRFDFLPGPSMAALPGNTSNVHLMQQACSERVAL